jgi:hypothetical protein
MSTELATLPFLAPSTMDQALAFANQMSQARLLPAHLQKSPADCLRVVLQAARWQMDPFAVADKTSIIQNKLMYEGQLVSAVVNARGNLSKRLSYEYKGEGDNRVLTVSGTVKGETEPRVIELPFSLAKRINKNGQMQTNPDQQAAYIGARIWARRHMPELMLGVYTPDEIEEDGTEPVNVTPAPERPAPPKRSPKGAAAVKQNVEVVVPAEEPKTVTTEPVAAEVVAAPVVESKPEAPAPVQSFADAAKATEEAAPAPVAPRAFLNDGEQIEAICKIKAVTTFAARVGGQATLTPSVKATLSGGYVGDVFHIGGAKEIAPAVVVDGVEKTPAVYGANPPWIAGMEVRVKLAGKKSAAGPVRVSVQSVEAVTEEF